MPQTWALFAAASVLLAVAGAPKLLNPAPTLKAAKESRLPFASAGTVRAFGAAEVLLAVLGLVVGGRALVTALAAIYICFAGIVATAVVRKDVTSCGCFAGDDSPPSWIHVVIDLGLATAAFLVVRSGAPSMTALISRHGAGSVGLNVVAGLVDAGLAYLAMTAFPRVTNPVEAWHKSEHIDGVVDALT